MAIGKQAGTVTALVTFCLWAKRNGFAVGEMHGFSTVHRVHAAGSWHYDQQGAYGKAADINHNQSNERANLIAALNVARELGLGVIFARDGIAGVAAQHRDHLHVDVGSRAYLGRYAAGVPIPAGGDRVTSRLQGLVHLIQDQLWGAETDKRLEHVRAAAQGNGFDVRLVQKALGVVVDGKFGPKSKAALATAVKAIQGTIGATPDGNWGPKTDERYHYTRSIRKW